LLCRKSTNPSVIIIPASASSEICGPLGAPGFPGKQHTVVHKAQYFGHTVRCHSVYHEMPWLTDLIFALHEVTDGPKMQRPRPVDFGDFSGARRQG